MNLFDRAGMALGSFLGNFEASYEKARSAARPEFIGVSANADSWEIPPSARPDNQHKLHLINSWVFSALVDIIGEVCAADFQVVKQGDFGGSVKMNHPFEVLIREPNPFMTTVYLWAYTVMWMKLEGNAYWFLIPYTQASKGIREIWPIPSNEVTPVPSMNSRVFLEGYLYAPGGREFMIPPQYVLQIKNLPNPTNFFLGLAEMDAASLAVKADSSMSSWNQRFYGDDHTMPSAIINFSPANPRVGMAKTDIREIKEELASSYRAKDRRTLVTSAGGVTVEKLGWAARDLDFIKGREFTRKEILEIFGIPEGLNAKDSTEANARIAYRRFQDTVYTRTLVPLANYITQGIIRPYYSSEYRASFGDIRPAIREMALMELDRVKGALTINEVREKYLLMPPLDDEIGNRLFTGSFLSQGDRPRVENPESFDGSGTNSNLQQELRRWREKSKKALLSGHSPNVPFRSDIISQPIQDMLRIDLEQTDDLDSLKSLFSRYIEACSNLESLGMS